MNPQWFSAVILLAALQPTAPLRAESPAVLLEKGIYTEETVGDLDKAITIYRQIVDQSEMRRPIVAQAMFRLGECYLKKGDVERAAVVFDDLKAKFPDQKEMLAKAQRKLASARQNLSEGQVRSIVRASVMSISTRPEGDPRVNEALSALQGVNPAVAVKVLAEYLVSDQPNVRRSAIYILWMGKFDRIDAAVEPLRKLCSHPEEFTRGMAALALGANKIDSSFDALAEMTLNDKSGYTRRCGAYALGLLGRHDAKDVLNKAAKDADPMVRANAQAALAMLAQAGGSTTRPSSYGSRKPTRLAVQQRKVGKPVSAFAEKVDLSTPESACAAYHRASARMDAKAVVDLSWVKIDPNQLDRKWKQADKDDMSAYNQAQRDATVEQVLEYGDWAQVISLLKFPPGVGRDPYSARGFGLIDGKWKNLGEDRYPSLEAAKAGFNRKKDILADYFDEISSARAATQPASRPSPATLRNAEKLAAEAWRAWQQQKFKDAGDLFDRSLALDPTNANAWNGLGWSQFKLGEPLNAKASFEKCLAINDKHAGALNGLGWIASNAGKTDEAITHWEKAVQALPTGTAALSGLANTYLEQKKYDQAIKYYRLWLRAEPDNVEAKQKLDEAIAASKKK